MDGSRSSGYTLLEIGQLQEFDANFGSHYARSRCETRLRYDDGSVDLRPVTKQPRNRRNLSNNVEANRAAVCFAFDYGPDRAAGRCRFCDENIDSSATKQNVDLHVSTQCSVDCSDLALELIPAILVRHFKSRSHAPYCPARRLTVSGRLSAGLHHGKCPYISHNKTHQ